jgi:glucose/arabinose dehydrogenase
VKPPYLTLRSVGLPLFLVFASVASCGQEAEDPAPDGPGENSTVSAPASTQQESVDAKRVVLFDGNSLEGWNGEWAVKDGSLVSSVGDLVSAENFGDYHLHFDFQIPAANSESTQTEGADSGIYLSDRWEVQIGDAGGSANSTDAADANPSAESSGAIFEVAAPRQNAALAAGQWQSMDIRYEHWVGEPARISVWLNGQLVQDDVAMEAATAGGNPEAMPGMNLGDAGAWFMAQEGSVAQAAGWGESDWAIAARFRTTENGTLVSRCPPFGEWAPDAKALFLRGGRLVYDIGWVGAISSKNAFNDGNWHTVVLRNSEGGASMWVDGELEAERSDFSAPDQAEFTFKVGAANHNFGGAYNGEIQTTRFFGAGLDENTAQQLSAGASQPSLEDIESTIQWQPTENPSEVFSFKPGDALSGPIRLQGSEVGVRFKNLWIQPLEPIDHADMITGLGADAFEEGRRIYHGTCSACHGQDGLVATNPQARPFASGLLENGADPYRLYLTIRNGFRDMPASKWLSPTETYSAVHYLREHFFKERNASQYFAVDDAYLASLPKGQRHKIKETVGKVERDYGPALASQLGDNVGTALTLKLNGQVSICYDLQLMATAGIWQGGFLNLDNTQHYLQRGEGRAQRDGDLLEMLSSFGWGHQASLDWDRDLRPARGPLPRTMLDYHGYALQGRKLTLSYAIDGREVLDYPFVLPSAGGPWVNHSLAIRPGVGELLLQLATLPMDIHEPESGRLILPSDSAAQTMRYLANSDQDSMIVHLQGADSLPSGVFKLEVDDQGRIFVRIPPSTDDMVLHVSCLQSAADLEHLEIPTSGIGSAAFLDPRESFGQPGLPMWPQELITSGVLGAEKPYALDTLTIPMTNPWNAWLRTSAVDFFEDGRAAVSMYGGDVWIVSGIDEGLQQLKWKRFAAGLFEPMGVKVIGGLVYVTCRDGLIRLHDRNNDGEADFYECFFADPDVSPNFHAFNFDLQVDSDGYLYYAKSGQYTDFDLGGAVLKIAPNGQSYQVYATGLRTPNGMGMSPDGDPLVSDNQGNWIPASKVTLVKKDGFYGVFPAINTSSPGKKTQDHFDPPVIWMPQDFDSSSGGQLWVDDQRFGPLSGRYLHTSFGKGWMYPFQIDTTTQPPQAAIWRLPFQFAAGIQRLRVNPADGQVYTVGLSGWQGPDGGADGCLQRVRYVGGGAPILVAAKAMNQGVELEFSAALDAKSATDLKRYQVRRWNYLWSRNYGSAHYSVSDPGTEGEDSVAITGVELSSDGKRVYVKLESMVPCHQLQLNFQLDSRSGIEMKDRALFTIHQVPVAKEE